MGGNDEGAGGDVPGPLRRNAFGPTRWFEDFAVGETFAIPSRTMTDALFAAFQLASGDNAPIHYDREFCRAHGHPDMLAHGLQVLIQTAAGAGLFPHLVEDSLVGFVEVSAKWVAPVYAGDTVYPALTVAELTPQRTTGIVRMRATVHNQRGALCLDGAHTYVVRKRPA